MGFTCSYRFFALPEFVLLCRPEEDRDVELLPDERAGRVLLLLDADEDRAELREELLDELPDLSLERTVDPPLEDDLPSDF